VGEVNVDFKVVILTLSIFSTDLYRKNAEMFKNEKG
jgi:hypothetical protein